MTSQAAASDCLLTHYVLGNYFGAVFIITLENLYGNLLGLLFLAFWPHPQIVRLSSARAYIGRQIEGPKLFTAVVHIVEGLSMTTNVKFKFLISIFCIVIVMNITSIKQTNFTNL